LTADELKSAGERVAARSPKANPRKRTIRWVIGSGLCVGAIAIGFFLSDQVGLFNQRSTGASPTEKSIAVLPFDSLSDNMTDSYFADGVQDEILNNLAKIAQLKVISRTSVMQYRGENKRDLRQIASALGVANILEGTVRRDGNHVRVSTELVDARSDNTIWGDSYDRDLTDIFAIQSEIAQKVALRLSAQLSPEERKDIEERPTNNLEAYDLYLQAKQLLEANYWAWTQRKGREIYLKALSLLREATQKDQKFALAYCLVAKAHGVLYADGTDHTPERRALGDAAVNEALRLRPDLPEAHLAMAFHLYICYRDFERASVQVAIAAKNIPNNSNLLHLSALIDQVQGHWERAIADLERAATLDPRNPDLLDTLARTYFSLRRYRDMEQTLDRLIELDPDQPSHGLSKADLAFAETADVTAARAECEAPSVKDDPAVAHYRVYYAICAHDFAAAEEILSESPNEEINFYGALVPRQIWALWLELIRGNHPTVEQFGGARERLYQKIEADPTDPYLLAALAKADVALGNSKEAILEGRRAMEMLPISEDAVKGPDIATSFAFVCTWANQLDLAFEQLDMLVKIPAGRLNYGDFKTYPGWDPLRKDPRFDKLLARLAPREPPEKSIAVLPFESLSDNKSDAYFADGVQDEILNNLAKIAQLKVISRTSVMKYRASTERDLRQIATALGVANVLEGTVRRDGNHVRVSTELIDASNDNTIWADSYDRDLTDIFTIQSDIAQTDASRLSAQLSPQEEKSIAEKPTDNLEAYDLYLQAKHLQQANYYILPSSEKEICSNVISLLEKAIQNDGKFALAYCLLTKAHDILYVDRIDHTPARVALGDAAVNEALRLRPDLPEAHLALAAHLYRCYRDFERAQVQIAIAGQTLSNNSDLLELTARIGREQGRWEKATAALERAAKLDPRNPELLETLSDTYSCLRRFQDAERILDRVIQLEPNQPERLLIRVWYLFSEKADVTAARAACASLSSSTKDDPYVTSYRVYYAMCARDYAAAEEILSEGPNKEIFFLGALVPRQIFALWIQFLRGNHPTMEEFGTAREQLYRKVVGAYADVKSAPTDPYLLMALAYADMALGRKEDSIQEGRRATELRPISEDAYHGPTIALDFAALYGLADQVEVAFQQLNSLVKIPGWQLNYGNLKNNPAWDPLRKDPRFDKLLAELAPRD
jgi:TolB-like protein/Flp pilus assembly protein TadD